MRKRARKSKRLAIESLERRVMMSAAHDAVAHPTYHLYTPPGNVSPFLGSSSPGGITPAQMRQAYGVNNIKFGSVTGDGSGQTIAIIDAYDDPNALSDLQHFDAAFGLSDPPSFSKLNQTGGTTLPATDTSAKPNTWELEESLDIEWAHVIAPKANIILYEASSSSFTNLVVNAANTARNNSAVTAISMSFGANEFSGETSYDTYLTSPHATFVASTGDSGSPGGYPAYSPNVVAVGGTQLSVDGSGNYVSETGWSGSGGGTSTQETEPSFQNAVQSTGKRTIPDVAMNASSGSTVPVYDTFDGTSSTPWFTVYGTSLASPMFGALVAIANQGRVINGQSVLNGATQTLPAIYSSAQSNFHDITSGSNGAFTAGPGYDEVTGRGTPKADLLIPYIAGTKPTISALSGSPNPVVAGNNVTLTATVSDPDAAVSSVAFYRESNGIAGLQTGPGGDTLLGTDTTAADGWTNTSSTAGLSSSATYYAQATDAAGVSSGVASTNVTISPATPTATVAFAKSDSGTAGTWTGVYGSDGYSIFNDATSLPAYAQVTPINNLNWTWDRSPNDSRYMQDSPGSLNRTAACYFGPNSFSLDVNLTDGKAHQVAVYMLDWENAGRSQTVQVSDVGTNTVLDTRQVTAFSGGQWLVWNISGHVQITFINNFQNTNYPNAVVDGILFAPVPPAVTSSAAYVKTDTSSGGTWSGVYGADGYSMFDTPNTSLPAYSQLSVTNQLQWLWDQSPNDGRYLQDSFNSSSRTASCYFAPNSFTLDLNLTDGKSHRVALYMLDWENAGRSQTVAVSDAGTNTVLDTRQVNNFSGGQWLVWNLSGHVKITITNNFANTNYPNAVADGIFFG